MDNGQRTHDNVFYDVHVKPRVLNRVMLRGGGVYPHQVCLKVVLHPFVGNLGQNVVRLLMLVFGIAHHHLDDRGLQLRQGAHAGAELL